MKAVVMCPMWKRPMLTNYVFNHYNKMKSALLPSVDLILIAVGSEGKTSREIAECNGFDYLEYPNIPLNRKFNAGAKYAESYDPDMLFLLSSDDIISADYFRAIKAKAEAETVVGLLDIYFLDLENKSLGYWSGYPDNQGRRGEPVGPGRCFSRKVLEKCGWQPWPQKREINKGLDGSCRNRLKGLGIKLKGRYMDEMGCFAMDIKTDVNIWAWDRIKYKEVIRGNRMEAILKEAGVGSILDLRTQ